MTLIKLATSIVLAAAVFAGAAGCVNQRANQREAASVAAYPATGQTVVVNGVRVHYERSGAGPDVILIHGALGNMRDMTFDLRDRLTANYRVTTFDRPGFGYSDALPGGDASLLGQAMILQLAAKDLGITRPIVMGHSYGGSVAMAWGLNPDVLPPAALVLVSAPTLPWPGTLDILYRVTGSPVGAALVVPLITAFVTDDFLNKSVTGIFKPSAVPAGYADFIGSGLTLRRTSLRANGKQVNTLRDQLVAMEQRYPGLTLPVELVHGDQDTSVPLHIHAAPLALVLPDANLTIVPGAGHMPHHTHPQMIVGAIDRAAQRAQLR